MPAAFAVVSRAIAYELELRGENAKVYVDDTIGVSWNDKVVGEMSDAKRVMTLLLGDEAVADNKTDFTTKEKPQIVALGWCIDLEKQIVTISKGDLSFLQRQFGR